MEDNEDLDALILELIKEKMDNVRDEINMLIKNHCDDPTAHPHAHDMDVSAAVEEHLSAAATEITAAIEAVEPEPETQPEALPPPEPVSTETSSDSPKVDAEKAPERHHPLHGRIGGSR